MCTVITPSQGLVVRWIVRKQMDRTDAACVQGVFFIIFFPLSACPSRNCGRMLSRYRSLLWQLALMVDRKISGCISVCVCGGKIYFNSSYLLFVILFFLQIFTLNVLLMV